jgi:hypothetical protein
MLSPSPLQPQEHPPTTFPATTLTFHRLRQTARPPASLHPCKASTWNALSFSPSISTSHSLPSLSPGHCYLSYETFSASLLPLNLASHPLQVPTSPSPTCVLASSLPLDTLAHRIPYSQVGVAGLALITISVSASMLTCHTLGWGLLQGHRCHSVWGPTLIAHSL